MKRFEDRFKKSDIICANNFRLATCMVVDELVEGDKPAYRCLDLVEEDQKWLAYEFGFYKSYNWRIATDDDIANYLTKHLDINLGTIGDSYVVKYINNAILLENKYDEEYNIVLDLDDLKDLKNIINKVVIEE